MIKFHFRYTPLSAEYAISKIKKKDREFYDDWHELFDNFTEGIKYNLLMLTYSITNNKSDIELLCSYYNIVCTCLSKVPDEEHDKDVKKSIKLVNMLEFILFYEYIRTLTICHRNLTNSTKKYRDDENMIIEKYFTLKQIEFPKYFKDNFCKKRLK